MMARILVGISLTLLIVSDGSAALTPRERVSDYPAHLEIGPFTLGAEYLVHSFGNGRQMYFAPDFLVVEVAVFRSPNGHQDLDISDGQFSLRINGRKFALPSQSGGQVAASLKYSNWNQRPNLTAEAGVGDTGVVIGRPPQTNRFPGDPTERQSRLPRAPKAPDTLHPAGEALPEARAEDVAVENAFPNGPVRGDVAGFLYFSYSGKAEKIRTVELLYRSAEGEKTISLK